MGNTNRYKKYLRHLSSKSIDEKIQYLNGELKKTNMVSEMMTTADFYSVFGLDSGVAPTPDIPAVDPKTYEKDPSVLSSIERLSTVDSVMKIYNPESKEDKQIVIVKTDKIKSPMRFLKKDAKKEKPRYLRSKKKKTE